MQIEGKNPVLEALNSDITINKFFASNQLFDKESNKIIALAKDKGVRIDFVKKDLLDKKSTTGRHQGFIVETVEFSYSSVDAILALAKLKNEDPFVLLLDEINDPHNLGAIIRSAECAGAHGIVIPEHRSCPVNETVLRTSAGAASGILIAKINNIKNAMTTLKDAGVWIFAAELGGKDIYKTNLKGPIAIVIGSEGEGIHKSVKEAADDVISLPMYGKVNSLNASVSTGIVLYEVLRQRQGVK